MGVEVKCICSLCNDPQPIADGEVREQIKALRKERGWTQQQLAERAGMEQATISAIENGHRGHRWSRRTLDKFAHAFGKKLVVRFE
jgi:transcriptional regulator with XRE-family HTH domain